MSIKEYKESFVPDLYPEKYREQIILAMDDIDAAPEHQEDALLHYHLTALPPLQLNMIKNWAYKHQFVILGMEGTETVSQIIEQVMILERHVAHSYVIQLTPKNMIDLYEVVDKANNVVRVRTSGSYKFKACHEIFTKCMKQKTPYLEFVDILMECPNFDSTYVAVNRAAQLMLF